VAKAGRILMAVAWILKKALIPPIRRRAWKNPNLKGTIHAI
jgi:hypothetical protein